MAGVKNWLWTAFVPQAGVSLALAAIIEQQFSDRAWSAEFYTLMLAVIAFHELVGPVLMKFGIVRSGDLDESGGAGA